MAEQFWVSFLAGRVQERKAWNRPRHESLSYTLVWLLYTVTLCLFGGEASHVECVLLTVDLSHVRQIVLLGPHSWDQPRVREILFALFLYERKRSTRERVPISCFTSALLTACSAHPLLRLPERCLLVTGHPVFECIICTCDIVPYSSLDPELE